MHDFETGWIYIWFIRCLLSTQGVLTMKMKYFKSICLLHVQRFHGTFGWWFIQDKRIFPRNGRISRILHLDQRIKNYLLYTVGCVLVATGSLTCVHQKQYNGQVYLIVFNNDQNTPDEVTRFRFTCYVSSWIRSIQVMLYEWIATSTVMYIVRVH